MLIGIDGSRALRARRTGTENYSLQVIRHMLAIGGDHQFRLYCHRQPAPGLFSQGAIGKPQGGPVVDGPDIRVIPFPRLWTHVRLGLELALHRPDVLFVPSHVLPLLHPRRSVVTVHDLGYRRFPEAHRSFDRWYLNASTRFNARSAAHVLADSQATKGDLVSTYGMNPTRVTVVYLGRDESLRPVKDPVRIDDLRRRLGILHLGEPAPYILFVGTLQPRKNLGRLIAAFALLCQRIGPRLRGLKLVLAGQRGWLSEPIFERVNRLGLEEDVVLPGFVADEDLATLLSGAEIFAFPSLHEGFGFPVLEAQACGTPVLTANTSSLPEVAGDGALFVDPLDEADIAQGLERLLTDHALRDRLHDAGMINVQRFSWRRCAEETLDVLEAVGRCQPVEVRP